MSKLIKRCSYYRYVDCPSWCD